MTVGGPGNRWTAIRARPCRRDVRGRAESTGSLSRARIRCRASTGSPRLWRTGSAERLERHPGRDLQPGSADVRHGCLWIPGWHGLLARRGLGGRGRRPWERPPRSCPETHPARGTGRTQARWSGVRRRCRRHHGPQFRDRRADRHQAEGALRIRGQGVAALLDAGGSIQVAEDDPHHPVGAGPQRSTGAAGRGTLELVSTGPARHELLLPPVHEQCEYERSPVLYAAKLE